MRLSRPHSSLHIFGFAFLGKASAARRTKKEDDKLTPKIWVGATLEQVKRQIAKFCTVTRRGILVTKSARMRDPHGKTFCESLKAEKVKKNASNILVKAVKIT